MLVSARKGLFGGCGPTLDLNIEVVKSFQWAECPEVCFDVHFATAKGEVTLSNN